MPFSDCLRRRALVYHSGGVSARAIADALADEGPQPDKESLRSLTRARPQCPRGCCKSSLFRFPARNETARKEKERKGKDINCFSNGLSAFFTKSPTIDTIVRSSIISDPLFGGVPLRR